MGAKPAEANRLLSISGAASRIHSRLGWPVRLSKGNTSRMRPWPPAVGPLSIGAWAGADSVMQSATASAAAALPANCRIGKKRDE
jgi:hypothetical protein